MSMMTNLATLSNRSGRVRRCSSTCLQLAAVFLAFTVLLPLRVAAEELTFHGPTMGTTYRVKLIAPPGWDDAARVEAGIAAVLRDVDERMSTYRPDSEVCRFNRAAANEWFPVSTATAEVVATALDVSRKTDGALDITVGPLVRLWHFGPKQPSDEAATEMTPPSEETLAEARQFTGYQRLEVRRKPPALRKEVDRLEIDLSAVAKGYAVDRVAELLVERGIENYLVEVGGEVRAGGRHEDGREWQIAIEQPVVDRRELQATIPLVDVAVATSGDYRNYFIHAGRRYSHIIDPTTGRPVEHSLASVTVVDPSCKIADAWATALLVLGPQRGLDFATQHGIAAMLISIDADRFVVRATPTWQLRFGTDAATGREGSR
jgi:thiamine biosynthesis lipoprotein